MDILSFHKKLLDNYRSYINSFINIKDPSILEFVNHGIDNNKLWLEPLIQFNPTFEKGNPLKKLVTEGKLNKELDQIFEGFDLYRHQEEAILLGAAGKEFVVTSGTGSGKSLTYLATVFNNILNEGEKSNGKIQAVIVYPMNALINSQYKEIEKFKKNYENKTGKEFRIRFGQYTGQEKEDAREQMRKEPPHILLTNYVMLEYIMTRGGEDVKVRNSILGNIKYLVFDELHTYRGRQGSDVSILIRRIKAQAKNIITCIGTSATMVSLDDSSIIQQREAVAKISSTIFGTDINSNQVINEYLVKSLEGGKPPSVEELKSAINSKITPSNSEEAFENHPTANWLEEHIALLLNEGQYIRRKPVTIPAIIKQLAEQTNFSEEVCGTHLMELLQWANNLNTKNSDSKKKNYLPYRIHQFISQTGSVYATLGYQKQRDLRLEAGLYADDEKTFLFPLVFSRESGHEFYCVSLKEENAKIVPREFYNTSDEEEEDDATDGYIFVQHKEDEEPIWSNERDLEELPDAWFNPKRKDGSRSLKSNYNDRIPRKIYFNKQGSYSFSTKMEIEGWFISKPLAIDPTSGVIYSDRNEWRKLARLGGEGRSTATTVISFETISLLQSFQQPNEKQKLLSFTDNRQDASLQSGHFNDFVKIGQLRAAINKAIVTYHSLDYSIIKDRVFDCLDIEQKDFAKQPATFPGPKKENEDAFKDFIMYKLLHDLRRSWRVVLPNLEQCGLLAINYKHLEESVKDAGLWKPHPLLSLMSPDERKEFLYQILDYFRKAYALSFSMLEPGVINKNATAIKEKLKKPWTLDESDKIDYPNHLRVEKLSGNSFSIYTESASYQSVFGRYIKRIAKLYNTDISGKQKFNDFAYGLFDFLCDAGWLSFKMAKSDEGQQVRIYQLKVDNILWEQGDGETIKQDLIKTRSYKPLNQKVNRYFQNFYSLNFNEMKSITGAEHTGQINSEKRKLREEEFRSGNISALFCSPTMELGIDISDLSIVHMRNVPPSPANYAQRSGRAGRSGQAALVLVYCSNFSPHDRYYYKNAPKMVAGFVSAPKLDLINQELLSSHLNGMILTRKSLNSLKNSLGDLVDKEDLDKLPLKKTIIEALTLTEIEKGEIQKDFLRVISDSYFKTELELKKPTWFNQNWIRLQLDNFLTSFDESLIRWRKLYRAAIIQFREANEIIENKIYAENHDKVKTAKRTRRQAERQMDLLLNDMSEPGVSTGKNNDQSEFYPYRYFASEGFLPGYNFTRLPIRAFLENDESGGEYVSRPRFIALGEFGPRNVIYHDGSKYRIDRIILTEAEAKMEKAKISPFTGYIMMKEQYNYNVDPFVNMELNEGMDNFIHTNFVEMPEARAYELQRITCQEEERTRKGYDIKTFFSVDTGMENVTEATVHLAGQSLLHIHSMPSTRLVHVNFKWKTSKENGFALHLKNGYWQNKDQEENQSNTDEVKKVKLFTTTIANSLYLQPVKSLALEGGSDGVITLMFALKRAIENIFQVEGNEIGATIMGDEGNPNILLYEASEGSLGVLAQIVEKPEFYNAVMNEAYNLCFTKDDKEIPDEELSPATYEDLLSYYNQYYHLKINRKLIRQALINLRESKVEVHTNASFSSYEEQYHALQAGRDQTSSTEDAFLKFLNKNSLRLPDAVQPKVEHLFVKPDFFYKPNIYIFCDGTPHDSPVVQKDDIEKRSALKKDGYQVLSWYYKDKLEDFVIKRPDIFKKVKSTTVKVTGETIDNIYNEAKERFHSTLKKLSE
jgi:superfamily II DNA/RNA helicase